MNRSMRDRQGEVFHTDTYNAILFLDTRFSRSLNRMQKQSAVTAIINMSQYLNSVSAKASGNMNTEKLFFLKIIHFKVDVLYYYLDCETILEDKTCRSSLLSFITNDQEVVEVENPIDTPDLPPTIQDELDSFIKEPTLAEDADILQFWKEKRLQYPILYRIAGLFNQIPMSEVNIERLFSNLSFILNNLRTSLTGSILNDIILIRSNFDIVIQNIEKFVVLLTNQFKL